jgi:hypothetical protein
MPSPRSFYHYTDAEGVEVIVQQLEDVPAEYRAQAQLVEAARTAPGTPAAVAGNAPADQAGPATHPLAGVVGRTSFPSLHWPSFAVGAGSALIAGLVLVLAFRRHSRVFSLLIGGLAMLAFGVGYLTFLRQQVRPSPAGLATPATILDDARRAAAASQKQIKQQEQTLDQINNMR